MTDTADNPAATDPHEDQPAGEQFGDSLNGSLMDDLRAQVETRVRPLLEPEPEAPDPRAADLSEEEQDYLAQQTAEYQQQLYDLEVRNRILEVGREKPQVAELMERVLAAQSVEELAEALSSAFSTPEPEQEVADVDRNNPPATAINANAMKDMIPLSDGRLITREEGLRILREADSLHG